MGSLFRSAEMTLYQLFLQNEAAYQCVSEIGELGIVQFRDLNPNATAFQRQFTREVRRCDEMERKLCYLESEIVKSDINVFKSDQLPPAPQPKEMIDLEATIDKLDAELREIDINAKALQNNFHSLTEMKHTLLFAENFLTGNSELLAMTDLAGQPSSEEIGTQHTMQQFNFVTGVVDLEREVAFERMLWRAGRGNIYFRRSTEPISLFEDAVSGVERKKVVPFIAFYQGDQLKQRVEKICDGFHASLYSCPREEAVRKEITVGVLMRLQDLNVILTQTTEHRNRVLAAAAKFTHSWTVKVRKIKGIYHTLNMFSVDGASKCLVAECWIPNGDTHRVCETLKHANDLTISSFEPILSPMETKETPPTFHRTNKFTKGFQALVNAYGVADYREVNPGLFTITTFPFIFAIMFGDAGHGLIITLFALYLIIKEKELVKIRGEVFRIFFGGRYIILMMGMFSMYTGLIYNDVFSRSFNIFGSSWKVNWSDETIRGNPSLMLDPKTHCPHQNESCGHYSQTPYPFGLDPVWLLAENKIVFLNSYKMKLSIILAVVHMSFGVFLTLWNFTFFKKTKKIFVEFLPRIVFFWPLFGYLASLMFLKWFKYGAAAAERENQSDCAPSILITFINMAMLSYGEEKTTPPTPDCVTVFMYPHQEAVQKVFLLVAVLAVPVLLFGTPIVFLMERKNKRRAELLASTDANDSEMAVTNASSTSDEEEMAFSDVMIYQAIHTIEYVLESISHTASYLRLWALSLAHAQLSEVLWFMVLRMGIGNGTWVGSVMIFLVFGFWAGATISILVAMEGMSAFLHTLRLHWVEFQSKFYSGTGIAFKPFNFKHIAEDPSDD